MFTPICEIDAGASDEVDDGAGDEHFVFVGPSVRTVLMPLMTKALETLMHLVTREAVKITRNAWSASANHLR